MSRPPRPSLTPRTTLRYLPPVVGSLAALLVACGGSGDESAGTGSGGGAAGRAGAAGKSGAATGGSAGKAAGGKAGAAGSSVAGAAGAAGAPVGKGGASGSAGTAGSAGAGGNGTGGTAAGAGGSAGASATGGGAGASVGGGAAGATGVAGKGGAAGATGGSAAGGGFAGAQAGGSAGASTGGAAGASAAGSGGAVSGGAAGAAGLAGAGGSGPPECKAPLELCGEDCVDVGTNAQHCGKCGAVCPSANGTPSCDAGACKLACNGGFADCDGDPNNGCEVSGSCACTPGAVIDCYEGAPGTADVGPCKAGKKTCNAEGTAYGACEGQVVPAKEICDGTLVDENCDGRVNETGQDPSCVCNAGSQATCYNGPPGTQGVGACKSGQRECNAQGTEYGPCVGEVVPAPELCAPGNVDDEDCNGLVNDQSATSVGCVCAPGVESPCYDGPGGLASPELSTASGICGAGLHRCNPDGAGYGACEGQILPKPEVCDVDLVDENCDGQVNEGGANCACVPGTTTPCFDGPANAVFGGTSVCKQGVKTCGPTGQYGSCIGQVLPQAEPQGVCTNTVDEDCNGDPVGPGGVDLDGDGWTACGGDCCETTEQCSAPTLVNPGAFDVAGNGLDDDCNGAIDDSPTSCDGSLASNSNTALDYARAMDLCQTTTENPPLAQKKWGVISAKLSLADGTGAANASSRSIRSGFGTVITPRKGSKFAVLSTGYAADTNDTAPPFAAFQQGQNMGTASALPADWLAANGNNLPNAPGCPAAGGGNVANDPVMLTLRVRVPTNAKSFNFASYFLSSEYPEWVCSPFNDFFVALLTSSFAGSPANPVDKNLAFYDAPPAGAPFFPVGVNLAKANNGLFRACKNGTVGCAYGLTSTINTCTGTAELAGTGMEGIVGGSNACAGGNNQVGGGTGYLTSTGNVKPGETIEIRLAVWDTGDHIYDSVLLLDAWTWSLNAAQPGTSGGN